MKLPQLHIRDLFWLVLVVALGLGWWVSHGGGSWMQKWLSPRDSRRIAVYSVEDVRQVRAGVADFDSLIREIEAMSIRVAGSPLGAGAAFPDFQRTFPWSSIM